MLPDNHAFVHVNASADKKGAAFLQAVQRVCRRLPLAVGDERAGGPLRNLALIGNVAVE